MKSLWTTLLFVTLLGYPLEGWAIGISNANPLVQAILGTTTDSIDPTKISYTDVSITAKLSSFPLGTTWNGLTLINKQYISSWPININWYGLTWQNKGTTPITVQSYGPTGTPTITYAGWVQVSSGTVQPPLIATQVITATPPTTPSATPVILQHNDTVYEVFQFSGHSIIYKPLDSLTQYSFSIILPNTPPPPQTKAVTITATATPKNSYKIWFKEAKQSTTITVQQ